MTGQILFSNSPTASRNFTINYFYERAVGVGSAQLACPFFTDATPLKILRDAGCGKIQLLVRLCAITNPASLQQAKDLGDVQVRYFTAESFHAKFYILGSVALIGSANLTGSGLKSNRELSVVVTNLEEWFDEVPALFEDLWSRGAVLTDQALKRFAEWHRTGRPPRESDRIEGLDDAAPETVSVASKTQTRERTYLESYRREYYETFIPCHREITKIYTSLDRRHPDFSSYDFDYEIDRFLSWTKLTYTTDEKLDENPIRTGEDLKDNVLFHIREWFSSSQKIDEQRVTRLSKLKSIFSERDSIDHIGFEDLTDALLGCAAFDQQLRFTKGGQKELVREFQRDNSLPRVRNTFKWLAFGEDEFVRRTYDCLYSPELKLQHFGRSCVMELFGWINADNVPPLNMRAVKAMRYLGFDVGI